MSQHNLTQRMALCPRCQHDLVVRSGPDPKTGSGQTSTGRVFCTNGSCEHNRRAVKLRGDLAGTPAD